LREQAEVEKSRLLGWLEAKAFAEQGAKSFVSFGDGFA
jgi:hypothetical protein